MQTNYIPYGSTSARSYPVSLVYSGHYNLNGKASDQNGGGYWWTSLQNAANNAYFVYTYSHGLFTQGIDSKRYIFALR